MWASLQRWMFERELKIRQLPVKNSHRHAINHALSIGILFDGTEENDRKTIYKFKKQLAASGKQVQSLAFVNNKLPLDNVDYAAYNLKNINWFGIPSGEKVYQFMQTEFDVLLTIIRKMELHYEFICAASKSKMIIGPAVENAERYFQIISEQNNVNEIHNSIQELLANIHKIAI